MSNQDAELDEARNSEPVSIQPQVNSENVPASTKAHGVGVFFWVLSLIGSRMGGGIVGMPFATQNIGFAVTVSIQVVYSIMAIFSMWLLLKVREITGESSLSSIGLYCYGRISIFFINILAAIAQLGFPIIFFIVFGDVAGGLIAKVNTSGISFWSSRWFTHTILAVVMIYLILQKEIHQLRYAGFALLILISIFIFLYFILYLTTMPHPTTSFDETKLNLKFFGALPTIIASYSVHPSFFTAFSALRNKTTGNGLITAIMSVVILFSVYVLTPLIAFGVYGPNIKSNMLLNVAGDTGALPVVLLFLYMAIAVMHIPIIFFVGKEAVLIIFDEATRRSYSRTQVNQYTLGLPDVLHESEQWLPGDIENHSPEIWVLQEEDKEELQDNEEKESNKGDVGYIQDAVKSQSGDVGTTSKSSDSSHPVPTPNQKEYLNMKPLYYYVITIITYVSVVLLSIVIGDVSIFFGIIGSVVSSFMVMAGPGSFYIIAIHKKKSEFDGAKSILVYISP